MALSYHLITLLNNLGGVTGPFPSSTYFPTLGMGAQCFPLYLTLRALMPRRDEVPPFIFGDPL